MSNPSPDTFFAKYVQQSKEEGKYVFSRIEAAEWSRRFREIKHLMPRMIGELVSRRTYASGKSAFSVLENATMEVAKLLCVFMNSDYCAMDDESLNLDHIKIEARLRDLSRSPKMSNGHYVEGLRELVKATRLDEVRAALTTPLPIECTRFCVVASLLATVSTSVLPARWQWYVEKELKGSLNKKTTLIDLFGAIVLCRNDDAHGRGGGIVRGEGSVSSLSPELDEAWLCLVVHYLAPALRELILTEEVTRCLVSLQELLVVRSIPRRAELPYCYQVKWLSALDPSPELPDDLESAQLVTADELVLGRLDDERARMTFVARIVNFPTPRRKQRDDMERLRLRVLEHMLEVGLVPSIEQVRMLGDEHNSAASEVDPRVAREAATTAYLRLAAFVRGDESMTVADRVAAQGDAERLKSLNAASFGRLEQLRAAVLDGAVARREHLHSELGERLFSLSQYGPDSPLDGPGLLGQAVDALVGDKRAYRLGDSSDAVQHGILRAPLAGLSERVQVALTALEPWATASAVEARAPLAELIGALRDLLGMLEVDLELQARDEILAAKLFDHLDRVETALRETNHAESPAPSDAPKTTPLTLIVDGEELGSKGLTGMFRALGSASHHTVLREKLSHLAALGGDRAKVGRTRYLFNSAAVHKEGKDFSFAVPVDVAGHRIFFEGSMEKALGLYKLAQLVHDCGCEVEASLDGKTIFSSAEQARAATEVAEQGGDGASEAEPSTLPAGEGTDAEFAIQTPRRANLRIQIADSWIEANNVKTFFKAVLQRVVELGKADELHKELPLSTSTRANSKRYTLALAPVHSDGKRFYSPVEIDLGGETVYVEANSSYEYAHISATRICTAAKLPFYLPSEDEEDEQEAGLLDPGLDSAGVALLEEPGEAVENAGLTIALSGTDETIHGADRRELLKNLLDALDSKGLLAPLGQELTLRTLMDHCAAETRGRRPGNFLWNTTGMHNGARDFAAPEKYQGPHSRIEFICEVNMTDANALRYGAWLAQYAQELAV